MDLCLHILSKTSMCLKCQVAHLFLPSFQLVFSFSSITQSSHPLSKQEYPHSFRMRSLGALLILALPVVHTRDIKLGLTPLDPANPNHPCPNIALNVCCSVAERTFDYARFTNFQSNDIIETFRWRRGFGACEGTLLERIQVGIVPPGARITRHSPFTAGARFVLSLDSRNVTAVGLEEGSVQLVD